MSRMAAQHPVLVASSPVMPACGAAKDACTAGRDTNSFLGPRGLPAAAAAVAGNDPAPSAGTGVAGEPAAAARRRGADGDLDRDAAVAADAASYLAAAGRRNALARHCERYGVGGMAIAGLGSERDIPVAVIGSCPNHSGLGGVGGSGSSDRCQPRIHAMSLEVNFQRGSIMKK
jgi:hypothetical protein